MSIITVTVFPCVYSLAMNNVSSSDVIVTHPSQTQPGLLATAVPHSMPLPTAYTGRHQRSSQLVCTS